MGKTCPNCGVDFPTSTYTESCPSCQTFLHDPTGAMPWASKVDRKILELTYVAVFTRWCEQEEMHARWMAVAHAVGEYVDKFRLDPVDPLITMEKWSGIIDAMRTGTLEDIEKKLGIEVG